MTDPLLTDAALEALEQELGAPIWIDDVPLYERVVATLRALRQRLTEVKGERDEAIDKMLVAVIQRDEASKSVTALEARLAEVEGVRDALRSRLLELAESTTTLTRARFHELLNAEAQLAEVTQRDRAVAEEMRSMAIVAGQASVEELDTERAQADARLAGLCRMWAEMLDTPLPTSTPPPQEPSR